MEDLPDLETLPFRKAAEWPVANGGLGPTTANDRQLAKDKAADRRKLSRKRDNCTVNSGF
jgi:hypothetical protein